MPPAVAALTDHTLLCLPIKHHRSSAIQKTQKVYTMVTGTPTTSCPYHNVQHTRSRQAQTCSRNAPEPAFSAFDRSSLLLQVLRSASHVSNRVEVHLEMIAATSELLLATGTESSSKRRATVTGMCWGSCGCSTFKVQGKMLTYTQYARHKICERPLLHTWSIVTTCQLHSCCVLRAGMSRCIWKCWSLCTAC